MNPALSRPTLAEHPMILDCLKSHGFAPSGRGQFSNGRAVLQFEGTRLVAIPGDGSRTWRSEIGAVPHEAVVTLLNAFLATPPFLSQQEIDRRRECVRSAEVILGRIVQVIQEAPDSPPSRELRGFLWSLFNGHHRINMWRLRHELDREQCVSVGEVFLAWANDHVTEDALRRALQAAGELEPNPRNGE